MTDCSNAEMRDRLPDFAADLLSAAERADVNTHLVSCRACTAEVEVLRIVRALRPLPVRVDVGRIVAQLPRPGQVEVSATAESDRSIVSLREHRAKSAPASTRAFVGAGRGWNAWRVAAAIGVIVVGGGSVVIARNGSVSSVATMTMDSSVATRNADLADSTEPAITSVAPHAVAAVSFGGVGDYTDDELSQVLSRLDQWDGATSTETMTTTPIVPVVRGGSLQ